VTASAVAQSARIRWRGRAAGATAARTVAELKTEIATFKGLEALALTIRRRGEDRKGRELANLLTEIFAPAGE
jgi:hypothetical protein